MLYQTTHCFFRAFGMTIMVTKSTKLLMNDFLQKSIPSILRKRKRAEYKLQAFVYILLLTIVLLVGGIYVSHKEKLLKVKKILLHNF